MNNILKSYLVTAAVYFTVYLFIVLYRWHFFNPFRWLADVPQWEGTSRVGFFFVLIIFYGGNYCLFHPKVGKEHRFPIWVTCLFFSAIIYFVIMQQQYK